MQKELGRYLLPVFRKKYNTVRHLKKYPRTDSNGPRSSVHKTDLENTLGPYYMENI